jgi:hypothetical protein
MSCPPSCDPLDEKQIIIGRLHSFKLGGTEIWRNMKSHWKISLPYIEIIKP